MEAFQVSDDSLRLDLCSFSPPFERHSNGLIGNHDNRNIDNFALYFVIIYR